MNVLDQQRQESVGKDRRDESKHLLRVCFCLWRALQRDLDQGDVLGQILLDLRSHVIPLFSNVLPRIAAVEAHLWRLTILAKQLCQQVLGALDHILSDLLLALRK